ncbi:hypothetical protein GCM10009037_16880 [Halarchaeum grantii]|uniref:Envelope protein N-terminal domain-containing protein n=1 Tax=Halarchaeum grantii TaxID=1193105 RepID=A0A830EXC0_9EURY|nr:twin-arginine translocation signal domain-containing protein [Halarchaeum grantii]GGL33893.1 hypothetical protein GCM10009037_16880 [Halarchaeum grantii]
MPETTPQRTATSRRRFLKGIGVGVGAAATGGVGLQHATRNAEAIDAAGVIGAAAKATPVGASVAWTLRAIDTLLPADSPPSGLTASALKNRVREAIRKRKSVNQSTFIDNQNIISSGLENSLYIDGKTAAIEALNNGATQSEVQTAAVDAYESHLATIQENLLKSWNESVNELGTLLSSMESHADVSTYSVLQGGHSDSASYPGGAGSQWRPSAASARSVTLADGSSFSLTPLNLYDGTNSYTIIYDPLAFTQNSKSDAWVSAPGEDIGYLRFSDWNGLWSDLQDVKSNVNNGIITWVENVYSQVQSGEISISDLVTPRMRANNMARDDGKANAIADLTALNIPVAAGDQTTIEIAKSNATLTLSGTMAYTGDMTIQPGTAYDPSSWSSAVAYFSYDRSTASGTWSAYETAVDGGIVSFTAEPYDGTLYRITTAANETVTAQASDFTPVDADGNTVDPTSTTPDHWEADLSADLATAITEVASVKMASATTDTEMVTIMLDDPFTVKSIKRDGESVDSATFEETEPQTDSNYITEDEWQQMVDRQQELIDQYEASKNSGGGSWIPTLPSFGDTGSLLGGAVVLLGGVAGISYFKGRTK